MPRTHAAANAATMPSSSRRGLLKAGGALGTLAALAIPAAVLPKAEAAEPDPVFSAIAAVRSAQQERDRLCRQSHAEYIAGGISAITDAQVMAACSAYAIALRRAVRTVPTTAGGLQDWLALMWAHNTWEDDIWEDEVRPPCDGPRLSRAGGGAMNAIAARARPRPALCKVGTPPEGFSPELVKTPKPSLLLAMAKEAAAAVVLQDEMSAVPEGVDNGDTIKAQRLDNASETHRVRAETLRAAISCLSAQDLAEGAVQIAYAIDRLGVLVDCATFSERTQALAREHREALDRLMFSVLRMLEREAGVSRPALGIHELAPEHLDPWSDPRTG